MSRADEIAQGLRDETGALTFPLDVLEYSQGHRDYDAGTPPPKVSSASYDLGRFRAQEQREATEDLMVDLRRQDAERDLRMRELLKDRPDILAQYLANMAAIRARQTDSTAANERKAG